MDSQWRKPHERPTPGESIWIAVLEHDGVNTHVDIDTLRRERRLIRRTFGIIEPQPVKFEQGKTSWN